MSRALLTDLYELTMSAAYFEQGRNEVSTFDLFIRRLPENWGYFLAAGLESVIEYLKNFRFQKEDLDYLASLGIFSEEFLEHLSTLRFTGEVWAVPEGTAIFPNEPLLRVTAPKIQAQILESYLLNRISFQTSIATKASRICLAAQGKAIVDFGMRGAHDESAAIFGARGAFIGGCVGTSNVEAGRLFNIPVKGTQAHSFIQSFETELEAFKAWVKVFPEETILLIDTYDVMEGARNAVKIAKMLEKQGHKLRGIRLDSGDLAKQSIEVRKLFDEEGVEYLQIFASSDLEEYKIAEMNARGSKIDAYGVGRNMLSVSDSPTISSVYKLVEEIIDGKPRGTIKLSSGKQTLPGKKQVFRQSKDGKFVKDVLGLHEEQLEGEELLVPVFAQGKCVYNIPSLKDIRMHAKEQLEQLPSRVKEVHKPVPYEVLQSEGLKEQLKVAKRSVQLR